MERANKFVDARAAIKAAAAEAALLRELEAQGAAAGGVDKGGKGGGGKKVAVKVRRFSSLSRTRLNRLPFSAVTAVCCGDGPVFHLAISMPGTF